MKSSTAFPQSKIKEIALTDPDVKDISKPAIEILKNAAEIFAAQFFQKCFEEAHKGKRITSKISDFISVVNRDEALNQMLGQFIVNKKDLVDQEEEDKDIENTIEEAGVLDHESKNNSDNEFEANDKNNNENDTDIEIDEIEKMNQDSSDSEYNDDEANFKDEENDHDQEENKEDDIVQENMEEDGASLLGHKSSLDSSSSSETDLSGETDENQDLDVDDD